MREALLRRWDPACAFHGRRCGCAFGGGVAKVTSLREPAPRAVFEIRSVLDALGFGRGIALYEGDAPNALALASIAPDGTAVASIVYNSAFLNELEAQGGKWAPLSVLAHEVGHHVESEASPLAFNVHPWARELAADRVSGFALARLGSTLQQAQTALWLAADPAGDATHPSMALRLEAVAAGYAAARRRSSRQFHPYSDVFQEP
jgi:hypothetical protein